MTFPWLLLALNLILSQPTSSTPPQDDQDTVSVIGVGDVMLGTHYPDKSYLPPNDGKDILEPVKNFLRSADVTFGNLEGALLDEGGTVKECNDPSKCYAFKMPEHYAQYLRDAGFDMMSMANNHSGDFGAVGRKHTKESLDRYGIASAGLLEYPTTMVAAKGVSYGLVAFAPNSGTCDIRDIEGAAKLVRELAGKVDIVVVSFHGGAEGSSHQHVTKKTETFYGENRGNVYAFAHAMIDAGADVVFGSGPHVVRAVEVYKGRFIAYSLGNFCTYSRFNLDGPNSLAPAVKVRMQKDGTFVEAEVLSAKQVGEGGPQIDVTNGAFNKIKELTNQDLPGNGLIFDVPYIRPAVR